LLPNNVKETDPEVGLAMMPIDETLSDEKLAIKVLFEES
jgi:hypothetical protein